MNDVGEKIPNWFESARLYYAYTGDISVMNIVKGMVDYSLSHGISSSDRNGQVFHIQQQMPAIPSLKVSQRAVTFKT